MPSDRLGGAAKRLEDRTAGPWERWRGSYHGKVIRFIEKYCAAPKGEGHGSPVKLAPFQKGEIEAMFADGIDAAARSTPRGNGKSTEGAALCVAGSWLPCTDATYASLAFPLYATVDDEPGRGRLQVSHGGSWSNDTLRIVIRRCSGTFKNTRRSTPRPP